MVFSGGRMRDDSAFPVDHISRWPVRARALAGLAGTAFFKDDKHFFTEGTRFSMSIISVHDVQPRAQTALAGSPICELRDLQVEQHEETLLIRGVVSSFYHKQLAQEVVRSVCEGIEVVNSIRVR